MTNDNDAPQIESMLGRDVSEMVDAAPDIEIRTGPSAPRLCYSAILDVPGGNPLRLERVAHLPEIPQRSELEASAVNEHGDRVRP
jgi:hypothetical protein